MTYTGFGGVIVIPARTGIHAGDEHEGTGIFDGILGSRNGYLPVFQRLTKNL
jgi:hypothetical protein